MSTIALISKAKPSFNRTTFRTSRLLDFCSEKELTAQTGHAVDDWPLVILKELADNAIDACEESGIAPVLRIKVDRDGIVVSDNGPGLPSRTIEAVLDFAVRVSSREAYVSPTRGAQGNALKTILAMPFVLSGGKHGVVEIKAQGKRHRIDFAVDQLRQEPVIGYSDEPSDWKSGTEVKVHWPDLACSMLADAKARFLQIADDYTWLNPHVSLSVEWFGESRTVAATAPEWEKWKPSDPTSPHWYNTARFERLIAAYAAHDLDNKHDRTVREFVSEFRGLSGTAKQKQVLEGMGLAREHLSRLVVNSAVDPVVAAALLAEMRRHSKPVKPAMLGVTGRNHFQSRFEAAGCEMESFNYNKVEDYGEEIPFVIEVAFGWLGDGAPKERMGSSALGPFRTSRDVRLESDFRGKAEVGFRSRQVR